MTVVAEGRLGLQLSPPVRHARPAVDVLFRSAAQVYGPPVVGVVLTGGDHDGTDGLRAVELAGCLSIVQHPRDAVDPGMPTSAISGGSPDHIVSLDKVADLLTRLASAEPVGVAAR